jgi:hypothetical protein
MEPEKRSNPNPYWMLCVTSLGNTEILELLTCLWVLDWLEKKIVGLNLADSFHFGEYICGCVNFRRTDLLVVLN